MVWPLASVRGQVHPGCGSRRWIAQTMSRASPQQIRQVLEHRLARYEISKRIVIAGAAGIRRPLGASWGAGMRVGQRSRRGRSLLRGDVAAALAYCCRTRGARLPSAASARLPGRAAPAKAHTRTLSGHPCTHHLHGISLIFTSYIDKTMITMRKRMNVMALAAGVRGTARLSRLSAGWVCCGAVCGAGGAGLASGGLWAECGVAGGCPGRGEMGLR
jgi:hypothetical protein